MKIAIPTVDGRLCECLAECRQFALLDLDETTMTLRSTTWLDMPPLDGGELPRWLRRQGVQVLVAGSLEPPTQQLLCEAGLRVVVGAPTYRVEALAARYLMGRLDMAKMACDP
jgi:predicted Fe-Mo cluster-binding NifX family protein